MANTKSKNKRIAESILLLSIIGIASSFAFVFSALASGIVPGEVITLANSARAKSNLPALTESARLSAAAQSKAADMLKNDYFAHTSPAGTEPWYWIKQAGYQYQAAGENLAINYTDAQEQHNAWMKSETHRANILNARYRDIGVAVVKGKINGKESLVTVEYFAAPLVAVADRVAPVPGAALPAPAIKGVASEPEGVSPEQAMPTEKIRPLLPIVPLERRSSDDFIWLSIVCALLLALCAVAAPLVFVGRAYGCLLRRSVSVSKTKQRAVTAHEEPRPLWAEAIHDRVWAL